MAPVLCPKCKVCDVKKFCIENGPLLLQVQEALNVGWRIGESVRAATLNVLLSATSVGRSATRAAAGSLQEVGLQEACLKFPGLPMETQITR